METIFNHAVTDREFKLLFGDSNRADFERQYDPLPDEANLDLSRLYALRKNTERAKGYLEKIQDSQYKFSVLQNG